jgi:hypothetical protein
MKKPYNCPHILEINGTDECSAARSMEKMFIMTGVVVILHPDRVEIEDWHWLLQEAIRILTERG